MLKNSLDEVKVIIDLEIFPEVAAITPGLDRAPDKLPEPPGVQVFLGLVKLGVPVEFQYQNTGFPFAYLEIQSPSSQQVP